MVTECPLCIGRPIRIIWVICKKFSNFPLPKICQVLLLYIFFSLCVQRNSNICANLNVESQLSKNMKTSGLESNCKLMIQYCQRHNGPKALRTLAHSTPGRILIKLGNLGQNSAFFGKGRETSLISPCSDFNKSLF